MKKHFASLSFYLKTIWESEKRIFVIIAVSVLLGTFTSYVGIYFLKFLLDFLESGSYSIAIVWTLFCLAVMYLSDNISSALSLALSNAYYRINTRLRSKILNISTSIRFEELEDPEMLKNFELANECLNKSVFSNYTQILVNTVSAVFVISGTIYITFEIKWWMALLALTVTAVNTVCNVLLSKNEIERFDEETAVGKQLEYSRFWLTDISRAKEVRAYSLQRYIVGKLREYNDKLFTVLHSFTKKQKNPHLIIEIINSVQLFVVYAFCAYRMVADGMSAGDFMLYSSAVFAFGNSLGNVTNSVISFWHTSSLMTKLTDVLNIEKKLKEKVLYNKELRTIEFRNVSFAYAGSDKNALEDVSFIVCANEKISLIGENGAGKSTLVKLLLGLYVPKKGAIYINGEPMDTDKYDYTPMFSAVFQDFKIFSFTVEENIKMSENTLTEAEKAKIRALTSSMGMPELDTNSFITQIFSDDGIEFSGGETQKIALIRVLYKNSPLIILDEPTSALSPQSEYEIYHNFNSLTNGKTVFFISHRLSSCRICDRIILLHNGKLEAIGTHEELFESNELYNRMFSAQAELYAE
ncbi:MAG: ABC transporter ATP-binding protein [Clostridiales bacterium]|nr:ABC transporter ATP-binding protein [Clostridiales bacterium]